MTANEDLEELTPAARRRLDALSKQVKAGKSKTHEEAKRAMGL